MNIFCIELRNWITRKDPGKLMQTYWYRNNVKNKAIYEPDSLIGRFYIENFLAENIWELNYESEFISEIKQLSPLFLPDVIQKNKQQKRKQV